MPDFICICPTPANRTQHHSSRFQDTELMSQPHADRSESSNRHSRTSKAQIHRKKHDLEATTTRMLNLSGPVFLSSFMLTTETQMAGQRSDKLISSTSHNFYASTAEQIFRTNHHTCKPPHANFQSQSNNQT